MHRPQINAQRLRTYLRADILHRYHTYHNIVLFYYTTAYCVQDVSISMVPIHSHMEKKKNKQLCMRLVRKCENYYIWYGQVQYLCRFKAKVRLLNLTLYPVQDLCIHIVFIHSIQYCCILFSLQCTPSYVILIFFPTNKQ